MISTRLLMPVFFIFVSIGFLIATFNLPKAKMGDPNAPIYFPAVISIFLLIVSVIYLIREWRAKRKEDEPLKRLKAGRTPVLIVSTLVLGLIYALVFFHLGFLVSTILFLGALLFLVNGKSRWLVNIVVALLFSLASWYAFSHLLNISLP
ncbi:tripartite tricarboxylate transporter TctB family protein [Paludifilum halophilum]|uniref:Tripartite tricarboxylate transporter TctB family protein n=1 Tax=Paludifilum halophilum TaxID=1642702 RepID=A0A235B644_9BACL|nr:tripartite tricarboxylate transporter TctB family protein [Paludifilum halophilum]OYD07774.1 tripartite tricarboxylate transporter TctB family protein [Paludifilum halophilum]